MPVAVVSIPQALDAMSPSSRFSSIPQRTPLAVIASRFRTLVRVSYQTPIWRLYPKRLLASQGYGN